MSGRVFICAIALYALAIGLFASYVDQQLIEHLVARINEALA